MNFIPGEPTSSFQASVFTKWAHHSVFAYCSGNNVIILTSLASELQTICFDQDITTVDINSISGFIAVACLSSLHFYAPVVQRNRVYWAPCAQIGLDSEITSICWGNNSEIMVGSKTSLSLISVETEKVDLIWHQPLASPCYLVRFSRNSELVACVSKYDKLVKFFYRTNFDASNTQFNMVYLRHSSYVTDFKFRYIDQSGNSDRKSSNYNILYTLSNDNFLRVFLSFEFQKSKKVQHWGSLKLIDSSLTPNISSKYVHIIDNYFFDFMVSRASERLENSNLMSTSLRSNLAKLVELESDLIMVADQNGLLSFYLVTNLNSNPPKSIQFKKISFSNSGSATPTRSSVTFPQNVFPSNPQSLIFSDSIKVYHKSQKRNVTFANYKEYELSSKGELSNQGDLAFVIHDLVKKSLRLVFFKLDDFLISINFADLYQDFSALQVAITNKPEKTRLNVVTDSKSISTSQTNSKPFHLLNASLGAKFSGHQKSIQKLITDSNGDTVVSISRFDELKIWTPLVLENHKITLQKKCAIQAESKKIINAILIRSGSHVITYSHCHTIMVWSATTKFGVKIGEISSFGDKSDKAEYSLLAFIHISIHPDNSERSGDYLLAIYEHKMNSNVSYPSKAWKLDFSTGKLEEITAEPLPVSSISCLCTVVRGDSRSNTSSRTRDLVLITKAGLLQSFSAEITGSVRWKETRVVNTGIQNASKVTWSQDKAAISDATKKTVCIYNTGNPMLEYQETFEDEIADLDWAHMTFEKGRNFPLVLSIGFRHHVMLYTPLNFDYTNDLPSYAPVKRISFDRYTAHDINDSVWLHRGLLVVGIGNQMFINDNWSPGSLTVENIQEDEFTKKIVGDRLLGGGLVNSVYNLVAMLDNTLPVFHPQAVIQCLYQGKLKLVKTIFLKLYLILKEYSVDAEVCDFLDPYLGISVWDFVGNSPEFKPSSSIYTIENFIDWAGSLRELLVRIALPILTRHQQITLLTVLEYLQILDQHKGISVDSNGSGFLLGYKLFQSHKRTQHKVNMRDNLFGMHSTNKQALLDIVLDTKNTSSALNWAKFKRCGMAYWLDDQLLIKQFETISNTEFQNSDNMKNEDAPSYFEKYNSRNPINATLFYLSLKKKNMLISLWKICYGHPEQQKLLKFFSKNFNDDKNKLSAAKNAFALMGRHRFYLAACFFLLGDKLSDCVNVLMKQCGDIDLAIAVARVYESDGYSNVVGPVFHKILVDNLLPASLENSDRWLNAYVNLTLKEYHALLSSLISWNDSSSVAEYSQTKQLDNNSFLKLDPLLVVLYRQLRQSFVENKLLDSTVVSETIRELESHEFQFIYRVCLIYSRMGCDYLSLDLLRNWDFVKHKEEPAKPVELSFKPEVKVSPPQQAFQEFSMDSFGF